MAHAVWKYVCEMYLLCMCGCDATLFGKFIGKLIGGFLQINTDHVSVPSE